MTNIILAERDPSFAFPMRAQLTEAGFSVEHVLSLFALGRALTEQQPALIMLDATISSDPITQTVAQLRQQVPSVLIMLLDARPTDLERIAGLESGADEFATKTSNTRLLLAQVRALMRRAQVVDHPAAPGGPSVAFGPCELDLATRMLRREGKPIKLSSSKFAMLKLLVSNKCRPVSRELLARQLQGRDFEPFDRSIDVQVAKLRKLVEPDPTNPRFIQTVRNVGYVFVPEPTAQR